MHCSAHKQDPYYFREGRESLVKICGNYRPNDMLTVSWKLSQMHIGIVHLFFNDGSGLCCVEVGLTHYIKFYPERVERTVGLQICWMLTCLLVMQHQSTSLSAGGLLSCSMQLVDFRDDARQSYLSSRGPPHPMQVQKQFCTSE